MTLADWIQIGIQLLTLVATAATAGVAWLIYRRQKQDIDRRAEETRLAEIRDHFSQLSWLIMGFYSDDFFCIKRVKPWPPDIVGLSYHFFKIADEGFKIADHKWDGDAKELVQKLGLCLNKAKEAKDGVEDYLNTSQIDWREYIKMVRVFTDAIGEVSDVAHALRGFLPDHT